MKTLTLIRHAKSSWKHPELRDFDRPLNKRGKKTAPEMGKRLARRRIVPDLMITSPAKRALSTAKSIAAQIGYGETNVITDERLYTENAAKLLEIIRDVRDVFNDVMVVGHNPAMTSLTNYLTSASIDNVPTCGVIRMRFKIIEWAELAEGRGELVLFDYPKHGQTD